MLGCALPRLDGAAPVTKAFWAWLTSDASVEPRSETSIRWPPPTGSDVPPARSRPTSAASTLTAPSIPDTTSLMATPTFDGPPPSASAAR